jgi:signal transduction histidine kinase
LRAAPLEGRSLEEALHSLARTFTAETGVRARVEVKTREKGEGKRRKTDGEREGSSVVSPAVEAELYRIAQEALTNVSRHAKATEAVVTLAYGVEGIGLMVRDNGQGLPARTERKIGNGLLGMRERARLCGGSLRLTSQAGSGTTVSVQIPKRHEA